MRRVAGGNMRREMGDGVRREMGGKGRRAPRRDVGREVNGGASSVWFGDPSSATRGMVEARCGQHGRVLCPGNGSRLPRRRAARHRRRRTTPRPRKPPFACTPIYRAGAERRCEGSVRCQGGHACDHSGRGAIGSNRAVGVSAQVAIAEHSSGGLAQEWCAQLRCDGVAGRAGRECA